MPDISELDFQIDESRLTEEWIRHPALTFNHVKVAADSRMALEDAKRKYEVVRADVNLAVRQHPELYGLSKLTEALIDNVVTVDNSVQNALKEVNRWRNECDIRQAVVTALDCKKKALEALVQLHMTSYYANPRAEAAKPVGVMPASAMDAYAYKPAMSGAMSVVD